MALKIRDVGAQSIDANNISCYDVKRIPQCFLQLRVFNILACRCETRYNSVIISNRGKFHRYRGIHKGLYRRNFARGAAFYEAIMAKVSPREMAPPIVCRCCKHNCHFSGVLSEI